MQTKLFQLYPSPYISLSLLLLAARGGGGGSSQSSGASEKLSAALSAPSSLTATVKSATEITLIWSATTNATFYEVYRGSSSNSANSTKKSDKTLTTTSYTSTGLTPRTDYYYWLKACNSSGCSDFSTAVNKTTPHRAEFITTWKVEAGETITIPTRSDSYTYDYNVDCDDNSTDDGILINQMGDASCTYAKAGTYTVAISGDFPAIHFNGAADRNKILTVENWGTINWKIMAESFTGASNLTLTATDVPDLSGVSSMRDIFAFAASFNQDISGWTVSKVIDCSDMFSFSGMNRENLDKIKSTTVGWLRPQANGGLPASSATCRIIIGGL